MTSNVMYLKKSNIYMGAQENPSHASSNNSEHFAFYLKVLSCLGQILSSFKITQSRK